MPYIALLENDSSGAEWYIVCCDECNYQSDIACGEIYSRDYLIEVWDNFSDFLPFTCTHVREN